MRRTLLSLLALGAPGLSIALSLQSSQPSTSSSDPSGAVLENPLYGSEVLLRSSKLCDPILHRIAEYSGSAAFGRSGPNATFEVFTDDKDFDHYCYPDKGSCTIAKALEADGFLQTDLTLKDVISGRRNVRTRRVPAMRLAEKVQEMLASSADHEANAFKRWSGFGSLPELVAAMRQGSGVSATVKATFEQNYVPEDWCCSDYELEMVLEWTKGGAPVFSADGLVEVTGEWTSEDRPGEEPGFVMMFEPTNALSAKVPEKLRLVFVNGSERPKAPGGPFSDDYKYRHGTSLTWFYDLGGAFPSLAGISSVGGKDCVSLAGGGKDEKGAQAGREPAGGKKGKKLKWKKM